jgi:molybdate transport system substrate-binding protein
MEELHMKKKMVVCMMAMAVTGVLAGNSLVMAAEEEEVTLNVFAAASMTETLTTIQEMYAEVEPNVSLVFNFDSSGTLKTQIQEGAECDVFISAAQKQMDQLDITADSEVNTEGLDFVL